MTKRIMALLAALVMLLLSLPTSAFAVNGDGQESEITEDSDISPLAEDLEIYGLEEEYTIVPCCAGGSTIDENLGDPSRVLLWKADRTNRQQWTIAKSGNYYYFKNKKFGKVIEVPDGNAVSTQSLQCADYNGSDRQLWRLESMKDGTFSVHSKLDDKLVWDVAQGTYYNGTRFQIYTQNRSLNQRFRFVHTSTVEPMSEWGARRHDCNGEDWDVWDGAATTSWYYSHKNDTDLYINSASDLAGLAQLTAGNESMIGKTIHLTRDINLAGLNWTPIGLNNTSNTFRGSFNGEGHAIIGLNCKDAVDNNGLFGNVVGGSICNLAVKGTVTGKNRAGGIVGILNQGHLYNIYSEVVVTNVTEYYQGGIVGVLGAGGYIDHCTQNAKIYDNVNYYYRGGIAGHSDGVIRYCVNYGTINHNWSYGGGIAGSLNGEAFGKIEYCANHGDVGGGYHSDYSGGIVGKIDGDGVVYCCYNDGTVSSGGYKYIGGIVGISDRQNATGCINLGRVYGYRYVGGIAGQGGAYRCLNAGVVTGDYDVSGISGIPKSGSGNYALSWSCSSTNLGNFVTASDIVNGKICYDLNTGNNISIIGGYGSDNSVITQFFTQNIGSDMYPTFGSSKVTKSGDTYTNETYQVRAEYDKGYGSVTGTGSYTSGTVQLKAVPVPGCVFDHFEVKKSAVGKMTGWNGNQYDCPTETVETYTTDTLKLTDNITQSYTVKAVFKIFDDTPEDMKVTVKLELECTNDADGWNSDVIPVELIDSAGEHYDWNVKVSSLDAVGEKVSKTFDLGTASPVAVYASPDFGGGFTFHDYSMKARIWVNDSGKAMESDEVQINSYPFVSSIYNGDYISMDFTNEGNSTILDESKSELATYSTCTDAWDKTRTSKGRTIRLESAWLLKGVLKLDSGQEITIDLNGYPIIRTIKKAENSGGIFEIASGAVLKIIDSSPDRKSCGNFTGGSIQGGRSYDTGGLIDCKGTLEMTGGTLYNGGTVDKGGAIKLTGGGKAELKNVLISDCWSDDAITYSNQGGAIYMCDTAQATLTDCTIRGCHAYDYGGGIYMDNEANSLTCENVVMSACTAKDNMGGGVYQNYGTTYWVGGEIKSCRAENDDGGGFYQEHGEVYMENVRFDSNYTISDGGAFYSDTDDKTWFIGCTFTSNTAKDDGGAIYLNYNYLYLEDCTVTNNSSGTYGGGIYIDYAGSIDVSGVVVIKDNDGYGSMDNLVLENGAKIYDHGLNYGSDIYMRCYSDGEAVIGADGTSQYQLDNYFHADYGKLELTDVKMVETQLRASVFTDGIMALIIGGVLITAILIAGIIYSRKSRKGGA